MSIPNGSMLAMPSPRTQQILLLTMMGLLHIMTWQLEMVGEVLECSSINIWWQLSKEMTMTKEITNSKGRGLHEQLQHQVLDSK